MADNAEQVDEMMQVFAHPQIGAVLRYMQDMTVEQRRSLQVIASAFANRAKPAETVEVAAASFPKEQPIRPAMASR
jgi:hypothetical protein